MKLYDKIMGALAIPMTQWKPYTLKHLLVVVIVVALAWALAFIFAKSKISKNGFITFWGIILLLAEILKQLLLTYVRGSYSWSDFPFQLCSIPMYLCLVYPFLRKGQNRIENFIISFGFLCAAAALIEPTSSFTSYWVLTIQSLAWHGIILMLFFYLVRVTKDTRTVQSYWPAAIMYVVFAAIAILLNFAFRGVSGGTANLFFLGPSYPDTYILNAIYNAYGWIVESIAMAAATLAGGFVVYFVSGAKRTRKSRR